MGFKLNPHGLCVANSIIEESQFAITWHVDDNKISHAKKHVVQMVISKMEERFGKMVVSFVPEFDFIGMKLKFLEDRRLNADIRYCMRSVVEDFDESNLKGANTATNNDLIDIDVSSQKVEEPSKQKFHSIVIKLMHVACRGMKGAQPATNFLLGRANCVTEQDYGKL